VMSMSISSPRPRSQNISIKTSQLQDARPSAMQQSYGDTVSFCNPSSMYQFNLEDFTRMAHRLNKITQDNEALKERVVRLEYELSRFRSSRFRESFTASSPSKTGKQTPDKIFGSPVAKRVMSMIQPIAGLAQPIEEHLQPQLVEGDQDNHAGLDCLERLTESRLRNYIQKLEAYIFTLDIYARPHPAELNYLLESRKIPMKHIDMGGKEYIGQALAGKPSGKGKMSSPGQIMEGYFLAGVPHGMQTISKDEYREKCTFVNGVKQGYYEKHYRDGSFESGCLVDGLSCGCKKIIHPDGSLEYQTVHNGKLVGISMRLSKSKCTLEVFDRTGAYPSSQTYKKKHYP
jgi:hypothetical protein